MIQRFDRYVLRSFMNHWLVVCAAFVGLFTVLDLLVNADEFQEALDAPELGMAWYDILRYYLINAPYLLMQFAPYITMLSGLGTVTTLLRNREWTPVLAAGRPTWRAFVPIMVAATLISFGLAVAKETLMPQLLSQHESLQRNLFSQREWQPKDLWARGVGDVRLHADIFRPQAEPPEIVGLEIFATSEAGDDERIVADLASWQGTTWSLDGGLRIRGGVEEPVHEFSYIGLTPRDLERAYFSRWRPLDLASADFRGLLKGDPDHRQAETLLWGQHSAPFVPMILLALGLPFALSFERRTSLEGIASGLLLCALFFVADLLLRDLGGRGALSPFLAGTAPVFGFGSLGIWAYGRMPT
jgi:lipopolysaccharide export system permease protein